MKIPEAALQQHVAVLGKNGSGKTYAAKSAIVEPLLEQGRRVAIVDPTGAWWGLRSSRDGKGAGFKVLILGGDHGDLPLPALGGAAVARLITEQGVSLVADTSLLTVGERTRWFVDFGSALFRTSKAPLHLVLDEAHLFAPQGTAAGRDPDVGKMLHAANTLASGGRLRGIRLTMITQRPQKLHKDSLTAADTLIAMRVIHQLDRGAVKDWIDGCGDPAQGKEVLNTLANLQRGEGWVWYPEGGFLDRMKFPAIRTFDSSATPAYGEKITAPKAAAELDLTEIRAALADAVREAEANDPKLLRARIAELEREAKKKPAPTPAAPTPPDIVAITRWQKEGFDMAMRNVAPIAERLGSLAGAIRETIGGFQSDLAKLQKKEIVNQPSLQKAASVNRPAARAPRQTPPTQPAGGISRPQQRILDGLAWLKGFGIDRADRVRVAMLADQSPRSSGYEKNISTLKTAGLIDYPAPGVLALTADGEAQAAPPEAAASEEHLREMIRRHVSGPQWKLLQALIDAYPASLAREDLAAHADASATSSGFEKNVSTLRSLGFIDYPSTGRVVALPLLFLEET